VSFGRQDAGEPKGARFYVSPSPNANDPGIFKQKNTPQNGVFLSFIFNVLRTPCGENRG
jgi:hypothetical protein